MGLENRNGRLYYYEKERSGKHVYSRYICTGENAELMAALTNIQQQQAATEREDRQREQLQQAKEDHDIQALAEATETLLTVFYLSHGYHNHKGELRYGRRK